MAGEMSHEQFVQHLFGGMTEKELQKYAQYGQALFKAAAEATNSGDHTYDYLGAAGERIAQDTEKLLKERRQ